MVGKDVVGVLHGRISCDEDIEGVGGVDGTEAGS